jgi:hypothetical protein
MPNDQPSANDDVTQTIRVNRGDVLVDSGQHLHYTISVDGAEPVFNLACQHKIHFADDTLGLHKNYDVVWPSSSGDDHSEDGEDYTFSMAFISALKYTIRVELHDADHNLVGDDDGIVLDADYESENPNLSYHQGWVVHTPKG